jgi:hypothetical protein
MLEALCERLDFQSRRDGRRFPLLPTDDPGEMHGREQILLRRGQHGIRAHLSHRVESVRAARRRRCAQERQHRNSAGAPAEGWLKH